MLARLLPAALLLLAGCTGKPLLKGGLKPRSDTPVARAPAAPDAIGACDPASPTQALTFVHINDTHGHYTPARDGQSPLARVRGYLEQVRREQPATVFTSGGDDYEKGSVAELLSRGDATREVTFAMRYDVRVLGNHDFAWGQDEVVKQTDDPHARVLASNVTAGPVDWRAREYTELTVGCLRVGFFGLLPDPVDETDRPAKGDYLPGFRLDRDWTARARQIVAAHRGQVHVMVLLSHLGHEEDEKLAGAVDGIDVILGAHSHQTFRVPRKLGDRTVMVQAGTGAEHVSRLDLRYRFDARRIEDVAYQLVDVDDRLPVDAHVQATVERELARHAPDAGKIMAQVAGKVSKTDLARLAARAATQLLGAEAALVRDDIAFASLDPGPLSLQTLVDALPVQRQRPGTPGFTSFYVATIPGTALAALAKKPGDGLLLVAPDRVDTNRTYRLALTKTVALHPDLAGAPLALTDPVFGAEAWEAAATYARVRAAACQPLDRDEAVAGCTPAASASSRPPPPPPSQAQEGRRR